MPDRLHVLLFVEEQTEEILGRILARFKVAVNNNVGMNGVFSKGFNDQILKASRSLDTFYRYLRDNPRRLAVRRANPDFFRRINRLKIGDRYYQAYGNIHLLDNPFKEQVIIHRRDTPETLNTSARCGYTQQPTEAFWCPLSSRAPRKPSVPKPMNPEAVSYS